MLIKSINSIFPFKKLLKLLVVISVILQLVIVLYNYFTGYYEVPNFGNFLIRLTYSSFFTIIAAIIISYLNLVVIYSLNQSFSWNRNAFKRIVLQLILTLFIAIVISTLITITAQLINSYSENLFSVLIINAMIFAVVNIILVIILEAQIFFNESKQAQLRADNLEKELSQVRFEVLKSQINPHFMFNSLNVLSGLIEKDKKKAQQFIDEFSLIYRYILETIEKPIVTLNEELRFVQSYIFLQQIRYGVNLILKIDLPSEILNRVLPPLSLQTVLENAIKHNIISEDHPLVIEILYEKDVLSVKNNIQIKLSKTFSTGVGQKNLIKRYTMIGIEIPQFKLENNYYLAKLPLINPE